MESIYANMKPTIMVATTANVLAKRNSLGHSGDHLRPEFNEGYLKAVGITPEMLEETEKAMEGEMERAEAFLSAAK